MDQEAHDHLGEPEENRVQIDQGEVVLNNKFFQSLIQRYQRRRLCEDLEFINDFGGVCNILKTLQSSINKGVDMLKAQERKTEFG